MAAAENRLQRRDSFRRHSLRPKGVKVRALAIGRKVRRFSYQVGEMLVHNHPGEPNRRQLVFP